MRLGEVELREDVELIEASVVESPPGGAQKHVVEVTLIRSGTSKNGNHYPPDVLSKAVPLFEGATAFADHAANDNAGARSVRDIVGYYRNVKAIHEAAGARLRAQLHLVPGNDWLWHILASTQANPALCGVSIDATGNVEEAQGQRIVTGLTRVYSVDIVSRPAAGGSIDRLIAGERRGAATILPSNAVNGRKDPPPPMAIAEPPQTNETSLSTTGGSAGPGTNVSEGSLNARQGHQTGAGNSNSNSSATTNATPAGSSNAQAPDLTALVEQMRQEREAAQRELDRLRNVLNPGTPQPADATADLARVVEEIKRDRDLSRCEATLNAVLAEAQFPDPVVQKIRKQFAGRVFEAQTLSQVVAEEREVLAALTATGQIRGMGYEKSIHVGMSEYDQLQAAFDKLFDIAESESAQSVPPFSGIREAFAVATGQDIGLIGSADRRLLPQFAEGLQQRVRRGNLTEAETLLREADVTTASFSQLLGTSMNKRLLKDYQAWPSEWQKFTTVTSIKDFKTQTRIRLGAFGSLSTVAEDAAYTTLTVADTSATYTPTKRGNLVQVTRETIINDDLYAIKQIPQKLAAAAAFTLAEFVYNLMAPNFGNIYDAHPLFDSINHLNTGVIAANLNTAASGAALSSAALQAAIIKMRKQTNMASKPIGLKPRYLLTCPDLEFTAMTILRSAGLPGGNNNDINPTLKLVRNGSPMFVFPSKSGKDAALVRRRPLVFAPTVAKSVAIIGPSVEGEFGLYPLWIGPLYKEALQETNESPGQRHGGSARFRHLAAEAGKEVAEALRDIVVMVAGEAAKRAIWG